MMSSKSHCSTFGLSFLACIFLLGSVSANSDDQITKNCTKKFKVSRGNFVPDTPQAAADADSSGRHVVDWEDFSTPLTFFVKSNAKKRPHGAKSDVVFVLHLEGPRHNGSDGDLVNCFLSDFCSDILSCCYDHLLPEDFSRRYQKNCPSESSCRRSRPVAPCNATCFRNMVVNVAFTRNRPGSGGALHASVDFDVVRLEQSRRAFVGEMFQVTSEEGRSRKKVAYVPNASPVNGDVPVGFWVRYVEKRTSLQVGLDGRREAAVDIELWDHALLPSADNTTYANRDTYGWYADEVHGFHRVFAPGRYAFDIPRGGSAVEVAANCSTVIYRKWGQVQVRAGGSCLSHRQCPPGHSCKPDLSMPEETDWVGRRSCLPLAVSFMDKHWVSFIVLMTLGALVLTGVGTYFLFRNDNSKKRKRNYLKPVKRPKKKGGSALTSRRKNRQEREEGESDESSVIEAPARKSEKYRKVKEFHRVGALERDDDTFAAIPGEEAEGRKKKLVTPANRRLVSGNVRKTKYKEASYVVEEEAEQNSKNEESVKKPRGGRDQHDGGDEKATSKKQ